MRKGAIQIDYVVAVGIFLLLFAFVAQYAVSYFNNVRETGDILASRSQALELLSIADHGPTPIDWPQTPSDRAQVMMLHLNNNTLDSSGLGNNGTIVSGANCSLGVLGRFYGACSFSGTGDSIEVPSSQSLNITNQITVEAWIDVP